MSLAMVQRSVPSAGDMLRRAISADLSDIAAFLGVPAPAPRDVHLARRAAKRLRALARLAPARLGMLARQTIRTAAQARSAFGQARDADVRRATLASLHDDLPQDVHETLTRRSNAAASSSVCPVDRSGLRASVAALARDWLLCEADAPVDEIVAAAARSYRRARRRMKKARSGDAHALHRWRTAVVDHEYIADFLAGLSDLMKPQAKQADRLRGALGDLNDLHELAAWFRRQQPDGADADGALRNLDAAIARRRNKLRKQALRRGGKLYGRRPRAWRRKVMRVVSRRTGSRARQPERQEPQRPPVLTIHRRGL